MLIVMTDGDGTYPNQDIPRLLAHIGECDMGIVLVVDLPGLLLYNRVARGALMWRRQK
jgi:hypothetical protein